MATLNIDELRDRQRGMFIGLAVGDALGAAVEFKPPGTFPNVQGFRGGGPHGLKPGEWTDDTSMALALADSIADVGWDLNDQAKRYLEWFQSGKYSVNGRLFDIGVTTRESLARYAATRDGSRSGSRSPSASGNGSIMRIAPVAIKYGDWIDEKPHALAMRGWESSLPTHASAQCVSACAVLAIMLSAFVQGKAREEVLAERWPVLEDLKQSFSFHSEILEVCTGSFRRKQPPEIFGSGYVVRSLEAALWAFHDAQSFEEAVLRAVNLGDDADTTGAVCGQLAGAFWGENEIPHAWKHQLARQDLIERVLKKLIVI
jgi:ADP-ribosylglycohydrolase